MRRGRRGGYQPPAPNERGFEKSRAAIGRPLFIEKQRGKGGRALRAPTDSREVFAETSRLTAGGASATTAPENEGKTGVIPRLSDVSGPTAGRRRQGTKAEYQGAHMTTALITVVVPLIPKWECRLLDSWRNGRIIKGSEELRPPFLPILLAEQKNRPSAGAGPGDGTRRKWYR